MWKDWNNQMCVESSSFVDDFASIDARPPEPPTATTTNAQQQQAQLQQNPNSSRPVPAKSSPREPRAGGGATARLEQHESTHASVQLVPSSPLLPTTFPATGTTARLNEANGASATNVQQQGSEEQLRQPGQEGQLPPSPSQADSRALHSNFGNQSFPGHSGPEPLQHAMRLSPGAPGVPLLPAPPYATSSTPGQAAAAP